MNFSNNNDRTPAPENAAEQLPFARRHRMAVYGGSFDPVHNWHIQIAQQILDNDLADEVLFVPAMIPPHKDGQILASPMHRLEMLKLAIKDIKGFSITDMELRRSGKSFTYDTMKVLKSIYPDCRLVFIMGMDSLAQLPTWHRANELVQMTDFIVYPRTGVRHPNFISLEKAFGGKNAAKLMKSVLAETKIPVSEMSSTEIRNRLAQGEDLSELLPPGVQDYIRRNRLYI